MQYKLPLLSRVGIFNFSTILLFLKVQKCVGMRQNVNGVILQEKMICCKGNCYKRCTENQTKIITGQLGGSDTPFEMLQKLKVWVGPLFK